MAFTTLLELNIRNVKFYAKLKNNNNNNNN